MQTSKWGKCAWDTFFIFTRNYPEKIDNSKEHKLIKENTKNFYKSLQYILPCKYCRDSYKGFWNTLPIDMYLNKREDLTFWLYSMKDLVNKKLIKQEQLLFREKISKLINEKKATKENIYKLQKKIFYTKPSPPFCEVVEKYEKYRAICSDKSKTCRDRLLLKKIY